MSDNPHGDNRDIDPIAAMMAREPVPAHIVDDVRDTWLRRISKALIALVILFFVAVSYQQAHNGSQQSRDNHAAITSLKKDINSTRSTNKLLIAGIQKLFHSNGQLRDELAQQNALLKAAGLPTVKVPLDPLIPTGNASRPRATTTAHPSPAPTATRTAHPAPPKRRHHPPTKPSPSPSPTGVVGSTLCNVKHLLGKKC